jgi:hypothetical protein
VAPACMIEYPLINLKMCCMTHKFIGSTRIVNGYLLLGMGNMTLWSPKCNPARQREVRSEYGLRTAGSAAVALFLLLFPALAWSQTPVADEQIVPAEQTQQLASTGASLSQSDAGTPSDPQTAVLTPAPLPTLAPTPVADQKTDNSDGKQTKRMFWVVPNFAAVSAYTVLPPLSRREKFALAREDSVDYTSFIWAGILAGQSMALNSYPELHKGIAGYGRYYWRAFADQASGAFFTEAIVPALTREDPRYYTRGYGGFFRRTGYALSRVVLTRTDSGGTSFNFSEIVGNAMEAGLSNLYYPPQERGLRKTAENWGAQLESAALNNIIKEFWPDIRRKLLRRE